MPINKTHFDLNQKYFEESSYLVKGERFKQSEEKPEYRNFLFKIVFHQVQEDLKTLNLNKHLCFFFKLGH